MIIVPVAPKDSGGPNTLTPDQWRAKLGNFDWGDLGGSGRRLETDA